MPHGQRFDQATEHDEFQKPERALGIIGNSVIVGETAKLRVMVPFAVRRLSRFITGTGKPGG